MKKFLFRSLLMVALVLGASLAGLADTIRLKNGSVIRGQIVSFKNEQFTIVVGGGSRGRTSRITVYMEDVESIEFDSAGNANNANSQNDDATNNNQPPYQPPANTQPANNQPTYTPPTTSNDRSAVPILIKVRVRADNTSNGWTNSGFVVRRGQRLHITASGRVSLGKDRVSGERWSSPEGIANVPNDKDKLMNRERTGALIAVIGDDNDNFILVGSDHDFVAQRDGVLFLGVNEGNLADNSGFFDVVIEANPR